MCIFIQRCYVFNYLNFAFYIYLNNYFVYVYVYCRVCLSPGSLMIWLSSTPATPPPHPSSPTPTSIKVTYYRYYCCFYIHTHDQLIYDNYYDIHKYSVIQFMLTNDIVILPGHIFLNSYYYHIYHNYA